MPARYLTTVDLRLTRFCISNIVNGISTVGRTPGRGFIAGELIFRKIGNGVRVDRHGDGPVATGNGNVLPSLDGDVIKAGREISEMASNEPNGDGRRIGAVKKRSQRKTKIMGEEHSPNGIKQLANSWTKADEKKFKGIRKKFLKARRL